MPEPGSILDQIAAVRKQHAAGLTTDLELPEPWGTRGLPRAWLRVKPVDAATIERFRARAAKAKGPSLAGAVLGANASIVAAGAVAVVVGEGEGQAVFELDSPDLLAALEIPDATSNAQVVMALVGNDRTGADGYVIALSDAVARHSGYAAEIAEESLLGD